MELANTFARMIFWEYKLKTEATVNTYNLAKAAFPFGSFSRLEKTIWRYGVLAEAWGIIATKLSYPKVDYLGKWERGEK